MFESVIWDKILYDFTYVIEVYSGKYFNLDFILSSKVTSSNR